MECAGLFLGFCRDFAALTRQSAGHRRLGSLEKIVEEGADGTFLTTQPTAATDTTDGLSI